MDLLTTVRKQGSRGGVNFSWDEVANSNHRENYLGHSLKAPVGRWAKGRDLNWYAKAESTAANSDETEAERLERERKEELRRVKEAEEDAMAKAMGLPPPQRTTSGANAIEVPAQRQIGPAAGPPPTEEGESSKRESRTERSHRHGDSERRERRRHRSRDRDHDRRREHRDRGRNRDRSRERGGRDRDERSGRDRDERGGRRREERGEGRSRRERSRDGEDEDCHRHRRDRNRDGGRDRQKSRSREGRKRSFSPRHRD